MSSLCPYTKVASADAVCPMKSGESSEKPQDKPDEKLDEKSGESGKITPKCPFGYDSWTFKLEPLSCMICQALLYQSVKCVPCSHKFCKVCILPLDDCPMCGADIDVIELDTDLQAIVDRFIEGHCRIKRNPINTDGAVEVGEITKNAIYGDVSIEPGAFLIDQAFKAFQGRNFESAKSRLSLFADDIREQLQIEGNTSKLCSQLGDVLAILGDSCRSMGENIQAVAYYEESVECVSKSSAKDLELVHTLSISLNKIGDIRYHDGDLESARNYYSRSLDVRRSSVIEHPGVATQVLEMAVSLGKVAKADRNLGNEDAAISGFQEAINCLKSLKFDLGEVSLEQQRVSVFEYLHDQLEGKHPADQSDDAQSDDVQSDCAST